MQHGAGLELHRPCDAGVQWQGLGAHYPSLVAVAELIVYGVRDVLCAVCCVLCAVCCVLSCRYGPRQSERKFGFSDRGRLVCEVNYISLAQKARGKQAQVWR